MASPLHRLGSSPTSEAPFRARICASRASVDTGVIPCPKLRADAEARNFRSSSSRSGCTYKIVEVPNVSHVAAYEALNTFVALARQAKCVDSAAAAPTTSNPNFRDTGDADAGDPGDRSALAMSTTRASKHCVVGWSTLEIFSSSAPTHDQSYVFSSSGLTSCGAWRFLWYGTGELWMSRDSSSPSGSVSGDPSTSEHEEDKSAPNDGTQNEIHAYTETQITLVVFDFDLTILSIHSWGERIAPEAVAERDLESDVADLKFFKHFVLRCVEEDVKVAIASFGQYEVIQAYMDRIFENDAESEEQQQIIFGRENISTPSQHGTLDGHVVPGGKVPQLTALVEKTFGVTKDQIEYGEWQKIIRNVMFVDDSADNVAGAVKSGFINSALIDPRRGFIEEEWVGGLADKLGMTDFMK